MYSLTSRIRIPIYVRSAINSSCRKHRYHQQLSARYLTSSPAEKVIPPPSLDSQPKQYTEHITRIVDQIANLSLLEVADLNQLLKERLNIQDAPVMGTASPGSVPAQQEDEEEAPEKPREKSSFTVKLTKFDEGQKIKLIKEVKSLNTGMNLVQAKKFVESLPQDVKVDLGKDEAAKLKEQLEAVGGVCEIE